MRTTGTTLERVVSLYRKLGSLARRGGRAGGSYPSSSVCGRRKGTEVQKRENSLVRTLSTSADTERTILGVGASTMKLRRVAQTGVVFALALLILQSPVRARSQTTTPPAATTIPTGQLIQPEELRALLNATGSARPLILQVGSRLMFDQAHIPGSEYAGPASRDEGLNLLQNRVTPLLKTSFIVLYCGCCPWSRCPNVGSSYKRLHDMGFTNVKVLYIAENFGTDWVNKDYPVAH